MWLLVISFIAYAVISLAVHELGHFVCAKFFRLSPELKVFRWGVAVSYSNCTPFQSRVISTMGFGSQLLLGTSIIVLEATQIMQIDLRIIAIYFAILSAHFIAYPFRMSNRTSNDFNGMDADEDPTR